MLLSSNSSPYISVERLFDKTQISTASFDVSKYPSKPNMKGTPKRPNRAQSSVKLRPLNLSVNQNFCASSLGSNAWQTRQTVDSRIISNPLDLIARGEYIGPFIRKHTPIRKISIGNDIHTRESNPGYSRKPIDGSFFLH